jgi:LPXTG-motif cell wall-anchored protein
MCRKVILLIWLVLLLGPAAQTLGGNMASYPIPTVSQWGFILMGLSLAAAGTIVIWWRRKRRLA